MKCCDFRDAKVGDKVWSYRVGWLTIRSIVYSPFPEYTIEAIDSIGLITSYTTEGKERICDIHPTLFWNEFEIPNEAFKKPLPKLEKDDLVWVWNKEDDKCIRFFSHYNPNGSIAVFCSGYDSTASFNLTDNWDNWELYEPKKKG